MIPLFIGDIHAKPKLVEKALWIAQESNALPIFLGDLLDGDKYSDPVDSAYCVKLVRESGALCVMGNHELHPIYARDRYDLAKWWNAQDDDETADRIADEWFSILEYLSPMDTEWLRDLPLYIKGHRWIAVHAQLPLHSYRLPPQYVLGDTPTPKQIQLLDGTNSKPFWAELYDGRFGHCYFGHTRRSKLKGRYIFNHATLLDWDAKKGGTAGACFLGEEPFAL